MTNNLIGSERYLLDTNIFINAKDNYYNPEIIPAFWQWILAGHQQGCFYSIDKVCAELKKGKEEDYLYKFAVAHSEIFLSSNTNDCIDEYAKLQV